MTFDHTIGAKNKMLPRMKMMTMMIITPSSTPSSLSSSAFPKSRIGHALSQSMQEQPFVSP